MVTQKAQLSLREQSASLLNYLIKMLFSGIGLFEFIYTLRVEFLAKIHDNERMRVYKNSTDSSLACPF